MLFAVFIVSAGLAEATAAVAEAFVVASSRYYCSTPTITLEVKPQTISLIPPESGDTTDKPGSPDTAISDDDNDNPDHKDNGDDGDTAVSENEEDEKDEKGETDQADQESGQTDDSTEAGEAGEAGKAGAVHHNALIISRLTEDHALHTEINVDNITSSDQIFIDVFSGDQTAGSEADTVFISFENKNGTVKTVRIGLDEQIDNITVLDGISERTSEKTSQQTVSSPDEFNHIDSFLGLEQIKSSIVIILPDTDERIYFTDGKALTNHVFQEQYRIDSVRAIRDELEIRLVKK